MRPLTDAFASDRLAHARPLAGVRGVGKTTAARILARGLNCTGEDGVLDAPVAEPCGRCEHCAADRHVDVLDLDAAIRAGLACESVWRAAPPAGDFAPLLAWLRVNVHQHGSALDMGPLLERVTGRPLDLSAWTAHLRARYLA